MSRASVSRRVRPCSTLTLMTCSFLSELNCISSIKSKITIITWIKGRTLLMSWILVQINRISVLLHLAYHILEHRMIVYLIFKNMTGIVLHQYLPYSSQLHSLQSGSLVLASLYSHRGLLPLLHWMSMTIFFSSVAEQVSGLLKAIEWNLKLWIDATVLDHAVYLDAPKWSLLLLTIVNGNDVFAYWARVFRFEPGGDALSVESM